MYEVNANGNRSYRSSSANSVAKVAAEWSRQGVQPQAYAIREVDGKVSCKQVAVTTVRETARALASA